MASISAVQQGLLHDKYPDLYSHAYDEKAMDDRFIDLLSTHEALFGHNHAILFSTAGRTELGGNHTDHNQGKVIAATINLDTIAAVNKREDPTVVLKSEGYPDVVVDISKLEVIESEKNTTEALVRGIAKGFVDRGLHIGGWQANTTSSVLKGSGLSSSAAIEVLCATIFNHLYNNDVLTAVDLAIIGKFSENTYFGKPSGLMDQMACAYGGIIGIDFADEEKPIISPISYDFSEHGYQLVIVDTKGNHADLTADYASVPKEMRDVASFFSKMHLREVDSKEFFSNLNELRSTLQNDRAILRAIHFYTENQRVERMLIALQEQDMHAYVRQVRASGESSFCFLQNLYPSFHPQDQGLSLAIATTKMLLGDESVVRVHGGGFAGTIQAYVPKESLPEYKTKMESLFGKRSVTPIEIRRSATCCIAK